jgi:hypothetical protein
LNTNPNHPARKAGEASHRHHAYERMDPGTFAYQLLEHLADVHGDAEADLYLARVVAELFELSPIVREHVSDLILADLTEALHRHGQPGRDAARVVGVVQRGWINERG